MSTEPSRTVFTLRLFNVVAILQMLVTSLFFIRPAGGFERPTTPPDPLWLSLAFRPGSEVWDIAFLIGVALLVYSTIKLKAMTFACIYAAVAWGVLGCLWMAGHYISESPSFLFGSGLFAVFIASQHVAIAGVWRAEGVH